MQEYCVTFQKGTVVGACRSCDWPRISSGSFPIRLWVFVEAENEDEAVTKASNDKRITSCHHLYDVERKVRYETQD